MAVNAEPNSTNYDDVFRRVMAGTDTQRDGIPAHGASSQLRITSATGRTVNVNVGYAVVNGMGINNDSAFVLDLTTFGTPPTGSQSRIDWVVARYDTTVASPTNIGPRGRITVVPGTSSTSPVAPALTNTAGGVWDFPLAQVTINSTSIVSIVDWRTTVEQRPAFRAATSVDTVYSASSWNVVNTANVTVNRPPVFSFSTGSGVTLAQSGRYLVCGVVSANVAGVSARLRYNNGTTWFTFAQSPPSAGTGRSTSVTGVVDAVSGWLISLEAFCDSAFTVNTDDGASGTPTALTIDQMYRI